MKNNPLFVERVLIVIISILTMYIIIISRSDERVSKEKIETLEKDNKKLQEDFQYLKKYREKLEKEKSRFKRENEKLKIELQTIDSLYKVKIKSHENKKHIITNTNDVNVITSFLSNR